MACRFRLCFPFLGLLVAALFFLTQGAQAQQKPALSAPPKPAARLAPTREAPPPNTRRCRYVRLALGRDTTDFALA